MTDNKQEIIQTFGNKLRVRVSGLLIQENKILLIKHRSLGEMGVFWSPPGGGLNFGESAVESLQREFIEETGLSISVKDFLFAHEFLRPPLHAIELFFLVEKISGEAVMGFDPELTRENQIIQEIRYFTIDEIKIEDPEIFHNLFQKVKSLQELTGLKGFLTYNPDKK